MKFIVLSMMLFAISACGQTTTPQPARGLAASTEEASSKPVREDPATDLHRKATATKRTIAPVDFGGSEEKASTVSTKSNAENLESIRVALKPFQVLLGRWNGLSQKTLSDRSEWAYDWVSDPKRPSLRLTSDKGAYIRDGRLSYLPDSDQFEFKSIDANGTNRTFRGSLAEPIRDVIGDEKKPQRTYKLQLTELKDDPNDEQWRITFNQQENNRYILEFERKRGSGPFGRVDTVNTQREGTSFAVSDTNYGEKTCIISQGLGTISVSYKGQSFWVCCSGCKAAFEEDPEKWIAKFEKLKKTTGK